MIKKIIRKYGCPTLITDKGAIIKDQIEILAEIFSMSNNTEVKKPQTKV